MSSLRAHFASGKTSTDQNFLIECVKNKKYLEKTGDVWYLVVRNTADDGYILNKALKDVDGNNITDLVAGILAQELANSA